MGYRSENKGVSSPVEKYIEWKSNDKAFSYYDKEKQDRVPVKMPITFIALDDFFGVSGGEMDDSGTFHPVKSGIAAHLGKQIVVKKDGQTVVQGIWKEIKDKVKSIGGRYTSYTYAVIDGELVCFKFAGAALAAWFEKKGDGAKVTVKDSVEKKKGGIKYFSPVFETSELSDKDIAELEKSDALKKFDEYAEAKKKQKLSDDDTESDPGEKEIEPNLAPEEDDDDIAEKLENIPY